MLEAGTYPVRKVTHYGITQTNSGSVAVKLTLSVGSGEKTTYTGWIKCKTDESTKKTLPHVIDALVNLGYTSQTLDDLAMGEKDASVLFDSSKLKDVEVVTEVESFENDKGETIEFSKVKWVNRFTIKSMPAGEAIQVIHSGNANNLLSEALHNIGAKHGVLEDPEVLQEDIDTETDSSNVPF